MGRVVPLYPELIRLGNNVVVASRVIFITHDGISTVMNQMVNMMPLKESFNLAENIGCIEIGDNVFIGAGSIICSNVKIGNNVIISAGSVVSKDVTSNSIVRGVPAKKICDFDMYFRSRLGKKTYPQEMAPLMGTNISPQLAKWLWDDFYNRRKNKL